MSITEISHHITISLLSLIQSSLNAVFKNAPLKYKFPVKLFHIYYTCSLFFIIHVKHWTKENSTTLYLENEITLVDSAGSMFQIMLQIFIINHISIYTRTIGARTKVMGRRNFQEIIIVSINKRCLFSSV